MKKVIIASTLVLLGVANVAGAVTSVQNAKLVTPTTSARGDVKVEAMSGIVGKTFVLDGSRSIDDGEIKTFTWTQVSGPGTIKLPAVNSAKISIVPTVAGTYVFELVVTDATGLSSIAQKVEVKAYATDPYVETSQVTPKDSDASAGNTVKSIGDPDFDLLDINIKTEDIAELRVKALESVNDGNNENWDFGNKEIIANTDNIKTSTDLKTYIEAVALNDEAIEDVKVTKDTIEVKSKEQGKLLWFIPVTMNSTVTIKYSLSDSTEDSADVSVKFPWWHVFVKKFNNEPSAVQLEITTGIQKIEWQKTDNTDTVTDGSIIAKILQSISNVLKTKHDTVKNSIGNIR